MHFKNNARHEVVVTLLLLFVFVSCIIPFIKTAHHSANFSKLMLWCQISLQSEW